MIDCDGRPGHPLDRTVRGDRRSCGLASPGPGPAAEADRCGAGLPGGGAGAAGVRPRAPVDPVRLLPARAPVPLPAEPARLPQAAEGRGAAAGRGDQPPGPGQPVVVRFAAAAGCHPHPVRGLARDGQAQRDRRYRQLWVLRRPYPLLLGAEALPAVRPGRDAGHLVPGRPEDRRAGSLPGRADHRRRDRPARPGHHGPGGQEPGRAADRRPDHRPGRAAAASRPPRRATPTRQPRRMPAVDRTRSPRHACRLPLDRG